MGKKHIKHGTCYNTWMLCIQIWGNRFKVNPDKAEGQQIFGLPSFRYLEFLSCKDWHFLNWYTTWWHLGLPVLLKHQIVAVSKWTFAQMLLVPFSGPQCFSDSYSYSNHLVIRLVKLYYLRLFLNTTQKLLLI